MAGRRSRFTDDIDPTLPWPEYPRPQLRRPTWENLNGRWELAITAADPDGADATAAHAPDRFDTTILVPYPIGAAASGVDHTLQPDERAWMRRRVLIEPIGSDERLRLHFGGVDWDCTVWCDGVEVGRHRGAHDPWFVDLTDAVRGHPGDDHVLLLAITDPSDTGPQPLGKQSLDPAFIWYPACAGVWQTVWLERVPTACVERVTTRTDLAAGRVTVSVDVSGAEEDPPPVEVMVLAGDTTVATGSARPVAGRAEVTVECDELRPWSPDDPFLHDLRIAFGGDRVESYFGAREVGVTRDGAGILRPTLNGDVIFPLGLLDQGWWPDGLLTAPTDEALAFDIEAQKRMGFTTIRKHVKVEPARWYWHADRLGMMVWQDMPSTRVDRAALGAAIAAGGELADADFSRIAPAADPAGFRRELDAMLTALEPHPCIVVWVPFNEGWGQHDTAETLAHVAERDPSRLVDGPSGWVDGGEGDLRDHHRYGTEADFPGPDPHRPVVYGEFGGFTLAVEGHRVDGDVFGYGDTADTAELAARYTAVMETLLALVPAGLAGAIYTQTTDVEGEINGLLTYDRAVQKIPDEILVPLHRRLTGAVQGPG